MNYGIIMIRPMTTYTTYNVLTSMNAGARKTQQTYQYQLTLYPIISWIQRYNFPAPNTQQMAIVWKNTHHSRDKPLAA